MATDPRADQFVFLFGIDGVLAETPHEAAWRDAAVEWGVIPEEYDRFGRFYAEHVAGEPGETGAYRILSLLTGVDNLSYFERHGITDPAERMQVAATFRDPVKQGFLDTYIHDGEFHVSEDVGRLLLEARDAGIAVGAVSASESSETILRKIDAVSLAGRCGAPYAPPGADRSLAGALDVKCLGAKTLWHGVSIEKAHHYCCARGMLLEAYRRSGRAEGGTPAVVAFEDAAGGIESLAPLDFLCVGISLPGSSAMPTDLLDAGAAVAYNQHELTALTLPDLLRALSARSQEAAA